MAKKISHKKHLLLLKILIIFVLLFLFSVFFVNRNGETLSMQTTSIPSFPGAEGYGALSIGGRGGKIIEVTNLNNDGPGSLRAALETSGPRIIVFRVAGIIELQKTITVRHGYVTLAGQTAPGGGITLRAKPEMTDPLIRISAGFGNPPPNHTNIRYITLRHGGGGVGKTAKINLYIDGGQHHIIDHVSMSWTHSNLMSIQRKSEHNPEDIAHITISRNLFGEAMWDHPTGLLIYGNIEEPEKKDWYGIKQIDFHHNAFVHVGWRVPEVIGNGIRVCNNILYNYSYRGSTFDADTVIDLCNNYTKAGPMTRQDTMLSVPYRHDDPLGLTPSIYISGNKIVPVFPDPTMDNWKLLGDYYSATSLPTAWRRTTPLPQSPVPVSFQNADDAYISIVSDIGNNKRLDCNGAWVQRQDSVDTRLIRDIKEGKGYLRQSSDRPGQGDQLYEQYVTGKILEPGYGIHPTTQEYLKGPPSHVIQIGGYPSIQPGTPCTDTDHDGMPDMWETRYQLQINNGTDASSDNDNDGYTNIEEYLNGTSPISSRGSSGGGVLQGTSPTGTKTPTPTLVNTSTPTRTPTVTPFLSRTPTPTPIPPSLPTFPSWWSYLPVNLRNFLEQLYLFIFFFKQPSNMQHLLDGALLTPTP